MSTANEWIGDSTLGERFPAWTRGNATDIIPDGAIVTADGNAGTVTIDSLPA